MVGDLLELNTSIIERHFLCSYCKVGHVGQGKTGQGLAFQVYFFALKPLC